MSVNLSRCSHLRDDALLALSPHNIEVLDLSCIPTFTDVGMRAFSDSSSRRYLTRIILAYCSGLGDVGLLSLISRCPALSHVSVRGCLTMTDMGLERLVQQPQLLWLDMAGLPLATDAAFSSLQRLRGGLIHLDLSECPDITAAALLAVGSGCPHLRTLALADCRGITDEALPHVALGCPRLQRVDLSGCVQLSDLAVQALASGCPDLRRLGLSAIDLISDKALDVLGAKCPRLTHVTTSFHSAITQDGIIRLQRRLRGVEVAVDVEE